MVVDKNSARKAKIVEISLTSVSGINIRDAFVKMFLVDDGRKFARVGDVVIVLHDPSEF